MNSQFFDNVKETYKDALAKLKTSLSQETDKTEIFKYNNEIAEINNNYSDVLESEYLGLNLDLNTLKTTLETKLANGEFKGLGIKSISNQNGSLVITDTESKIYNLGNFQNPITNKDFMIGNGGVGTQVQNIFTYFKSTNEQLDYPIHIVTNLKDVFKTFCFKFVGHALNASLALDCTLVGYYYGANGLRLVDSTQECFTAYINSEGYLTIKLTLPNNYYTSLVMSSVNVGNGGLITSENIVKSVLSLEDL